MNFEVKTQRPSTGHLIDDWKPNSEDHGFLCDKKLTAYSRRASHYELVNKKKPNSVHTVEIRTALPKFGCP